MLDVLMRKGQTATEKMLESNVLHIHKQDDSFECDVRGRWLLLGFKETFLPLSPNSCLLGSQ